MKRSRRLDKVIDIVRSAGEIAMGHFGLVRATLKEDTSLVTRADVETGQFISRRLGEEFPGYNIINEETCTTLDRIPGPDEYTWVVDPIDGTSSYTRRMPTWTVAVGLMKGMEPVMGVNYIPVLDELYYSDMDTDPIFETPRWGRIPMDLSHCREPIGKESLLCTVSYFHRRLDLVYPGKVRSMGSTIAHMCYVARGDAVAAIVKGALWDIVPAWAILKKIGCQARYLDGSAMELNQLMNGQLSRDFIVISCPDKVEYLLKNLTARPPRH